MSDFNSSLVLVKYESLGNDYLVAEDGRALPLVPALCDRHRGVGADGLLLFDPDRLAVRIINPDGSEAEKSGNGLRIAAAHAVLEHAAPGHFTLQVPAGALEVRVLARDGRSVKTEVDVGAPVVGALEPVAGVEGRAVDAGNPHFVVFGEPVTPERCRELGPRLETDPRFPNRTNVQLCEVVDRSRIRIQVWERGAGYTLASGTSAAAAAAACLAAGLVDDRLTVEMPGGSLPVERRPDGHLLQTGSARRVFRATFELP
ncbi:MAG TPA: diaminopimelate epimerase [Candidatus Dormibacteraeota bacterium]